MKDTKSFKLTILLLIVVLLTTFSTLTIMYNTSLEETRSGLTNIVKTKARLIESIFRFDSTNHNTDKDGNLLSSEEVFSGTLSQVIDANKHLKEPINGREFTLARLDGENIDFVFINRFKKIEERYKTIPYKSTLAEPMRLALSGKSGTVIGKDYNNKTVLAAYEPLDVIGTAGLVAKIDLGKFRAPFINAAMIVIGLSFLLILIGGRYIQKIVYPLVSELEASKQSYESLLNRYQLAASASNSGSWEVLLDEGRIYYDDSLVRLMGYEPGDLTQELSPWLQNIHPDDMKKFDDAFKRIRAGEKGQISFKVRSMQKDGSYRWYKISGSRTDMSDGSWRIYGTTVDISDIHEKEEIMIAQSRQVAMGDMIAMIAHQWRQPISVIAMYANNLKVDIGLEEKITNEYIDETMDSIIDQTMYLSKTIDDFRNFFKPDKDKQLTTVSAVLDSTMSIVGKSLKNNNITVDINKQSSTEILTYPNQLLQVFINIINNAKDVLENKAINDAKISININETEDSIVTTICDNGGGIPEDAISRLGEPYFTTKGLTGSGLGLYMSKIILTKHLNGNLTWENKDGGACFTVTISTN